jgi:hypothetical protein
LKIGPEQPWVRGAIHFLSDLRCVFFCAKNRKSPSVGNKRYLP